MINEQALADLISAIFDWQVARRKDIFTYGDIDLRGALERHLYFEAISQPASLYGLLKASRAWRATIDDPRLMAVYDHYLFDISHQNNLWIGFFKSIIKRIRLRFNVVFSLLFAAGYSRNDDSARGVGFVAFNDRFVLFFNDLVSRISEKTTFFSINNHVSDDAISRVGSHIVRRGNAPLKWRRIDIPATHPLATLYMTCLGMYFRAYQILATCKPKALVFAEGTSVDDELFARAAKSLLIPTLRLQSGRAGVLHNGYRNMCFDKMLCWGEGFVERFMQYSPEPEYIVVGSPFIDHRSTLDDSPNTGQNLKITIFSQPLSLHITEDDYLSLVKCAEAIMNTYPSVMLFIRKHPADTAIHFDMLKDRYATRVMMMNPDTSSLEEVLRKSDAAIGFFSTTLSEAAAYGVIPLILKLRDQHSVFPFPERHNAAIVASSMDQVVEEIGRLLDAPSSFLPMRQSMEEFSRKYFGERDGMALSRIIGHIQASAHT